MVLIDYIIFLVLLLQFLLLLGYLTLKIKNGKCIGCNFNCDNCKKNKPPK